MEFRKWYDCNVEKSNVQPKAASFFAGSRMTAHPQLPFLSTIDKKEVNDMNRKNGVPRSAGRSSTCRNSIGKTLYTAFIMPTFAAGLVLPAYATGTIWDKASEIMQDVYTQILGISTIAAIVTAAIALLLMNFSKSGRTVDESRAWLKRIIITWAILNSLGFIMAYITPFFSGGRWNG